MKRLFLSPAVVLLLSAACGDDPSGPPAPTVLLLADNNRDGKLDEKDPTELADKGTWDLAHGAIFLANVDDDTNRCPKKGKGAEELAKCNDGQDDVLNGEDDLLDMAPLKIAAWSGASATATAQLTLSDASKAHVRLFRIVDGEWASFDPEETKFTSAEIKAGIDLRLEGKDFLRDDKVWDGLVEISLEITDGTKSIGTDSVALRQAPVLFSHHLEEPFQIYASNLSDPLSTNFVSALTAVSKTQSLPAAKAVPAQGDVWAQDYFDMAYMQMPGVDGPQTIRVYVHSSNYGEVWSDAPGGLAFRSAGDLVFSTFRGPDAAALVAFDPKHEDEMDSLNSFGNMEVIPPHESGGTKYPHGRVIRGHIPKFHPDLAFERMVESQNAQPPLYVDTSWLLVSHIDEVISFTPTDSKLGWGLLYADPTAGKAMFDDLKTKGQGTLGLHQGLFWISDQGKPVKADVTVAEVLADADVMATSQKAAIKTKEIVDTLKKEVGLTEADMAPVPFLFMSIQGQAIAFQPGMVNGVSFGKTFAAPDPHGPMVSGKDIFKTAFEDSAKKLGTTIAWVEDWDLLHVNEGEVHCGSNMQRAVPAQGFWKVGQ